MLETSSASVEKISQRLSEVRESFFTSLGKRNKNKKPLIAKVTARKGRFSKDLGTLVVHVKDIYIDETRTNLMLEFKDTGSEKGLLLWANGSTHGFVSMKKIKTALAKILKESSEAFVAKRSKRRVVRPPLWRVHGIFDGKP